MLVLLSFGACTLLSKQGWEWPGSIPGRFWRHGRGGSVWDCMESWGLGLPLGCPNPRALGCSPVPKGADLHNFACYALGLAWFLSWTWLPSLLGVRTCSPLSYSWFPSNPGCPGSM